MPKSLRGGSLLMTPLRGPDGEVYALAQGSLLVSGFGAEGADGSSVTVNIPSAGTHTQWRDRRARRAEPLRHGDPLMVMNLHSPDFTTAQRVAARINETFKRGHVAQPVDADFRRGAGTGRTRRPKVAFVSRAGESSRSTLPRRRPRRWS
jgi:flagellar P-ring protein precursor FlgI